MHLERFVERKAYELSGGDDDYARAWRCVDVHACLRRAARGRQLDLFAAA